MPGEYSSFPNVDFDDQDYERVKAIASFSSAVLEMLNRIGQGYPDAERFTERFTYISTGARLSQLAIVANSVIELAKEQRLSYEPFYLIDEAHVETLENNLKTYDLPEFYSQNEKACQQAIVDGIRLGTDDFLRMMVPETITNSDPARVETFFIPWRKDLLKMIDPMYTLAREDGGCEIFLPTRLPNIYVVHGYPGDSTSIPLEEIRLIVNPTVPSWM